MPSEKRARQRALRAEKQAAISQARKRRQNLRRVMWGVLLVAVVIIIAVLLSNSGGKSASGNSTTTTAPGASSSSTSSTVPTSTFAPPSTAPLQTTAIAPVCPPTTGSKTREVYFTKAPPDCIPHTSVWTATFSTSVGDFTVQMDAAKSYAGVNNFVFLALYKYYDGTFFHRVIPGFVVQGGDPTGTGTGGAHAYPGYSFTGNVPPPSCKTSTTHPCYKTGDFVYANSSGPTTNGSQFFLVLPGGSTTLDTEPNYTLFGYVSSGQDVVNKIGSYGTSGGTPAVKVYVLNVTVKETRA